jgi:hypothetical protein
MVATSRFNGEHNMAKPDVSALRGQLVQLLIQQGTIYSNWVKFAITVQGGLIAGLAFVLSDVTKYRVLGLLVAFFGGSSWRADERPRRDARRGEGGVPRKLRRI